MRLGLYTLVGLPSLIAGTMLLMGRPQSHYAAFAGALGAGGSALVWLGVSGRRIGRAGWIACGALAVAGVFGSLVVVREEIACMYCYHRGQGYPWGWLDTGFTHPDMPTLQRAHQIMATNPEVASRAVDWIKVLVDGVFWGYVALSLAVVTTQASRVLRRARQVPREPRRSTWLGTKAALFRTCTARALLHRTHCTHIGQVGRPDARLATDECA